jgi:hypothetical protein
MQIYQGDLVADTELVRHRRSLQTSHFRVRLTRLPPVKLLLMGSVATDAHAAHERAQAQLRAVLACELALSKVT